MNEIFPSPATWVQFIYNSDSSSMAYFFQFFVIDALFLIKNWLPVMRRYYADLGGAGRRTCF